jgi:hypothetical protein
MGGSSNWQETLYTAIIDTATSGDNILIAAPAVGSYIAVDFIQVIPTAAVSIQFFSNPSAQAHKLTGPYPLSQQQVITDENVFQNQHGVFESRQNESFVMKLGGAVQCGGVVRYRIVGNN